MIPLGASDSLDRRRIGARRSTTGPLWSTEPEFLLSLSYSGSGIVVRIEGTK
jgi:hypothetical protein